MYGSVQMKQTSKNPARRPKHGGAVRRVPLPVLEAPGKVPPTPKRRSRVARRRAITLTVVNALILFHVAHWLISGRTLAPVVFSESMKTLELGRLNPAFVLFGAMILATLLFGRFFCGWACHMAALQDLCLWLLRRMGMRPAPFRARLLPYIPVMLALYMFVWPTLKRDFLAPLFSRWWPDGLPLMGRVQPFPGWSTEWTTTELWTGLPGVWVAIPFLFVCGFASVYFLGARGFCNYGCPYGGLFKPAARLTPGRVVVDPARCDECGRCTAACASNVRVLDDLRAFGKVSDSRCVRSLDCVSVCPKRALSFAFTSPTAPWRASGSRPRPGHDPTLAEEVVLLGLFLFTLFTLRGLYDVFPLLFAVGVSICALAVGWKLIRMVRDTNVRLHRFQLKRSGRLTRAGVIMVALSALAAALLGQGAMVRHSTRLAGALDNQVTVSRDVVFAGAQSVPAQQRLLAHRALDRYRRASGWRSGGVGLADTPSNDVRAAWLNLVIGAYDEAESAMRRALARTPFNDAHIINLADILLLQNRSEEAIEHLRDALQARPRLALTRDMLCRLYAFSGRAEEAVRICEWVIERRPKDVGARLTLASLHVMLGRAERAAAELLSARDLDTQNPTIQQWLGALTLPPGRPAPAPTHDPG